MRNKSFHFILALLAMATIWSCKKQESQVTLESATAPVLTSSVANNGTINLDYYTRDDQSVRFNWTQPDYRLTTGPSSQAVTYKLEIDTLGANFTNPRKQSVTISNGRK